MLAAWRSKMAANAAGSVTEAVIVAASETVIAEVFAARPTQVREPMRRQRRTTSSGQAETTTGDGT